MRGPSSSAAAARAATEAVDYRALIADFADVTTVATVGGVYRYVTPACQRAFGWAPSHVEGHNQDDLVHPDDVPSAQTCRSNLAWGNVATGSYRLRCGDGSYRWAEATSRLVQAEGEVLVVSTIRDITERQAMTADLQRLATSDPLTGLANRTLLLDRLRQALRRLDRGRGLLVVAYIDLDRFKALNDALGHRTGDEVLTKMADRLHHHVRSPDTLARLGGDEFVVVAEEVADEQAAIELGNRLVQAGRAPLRVGDEDFSCTLSVGIASTADPGRDPEDLLQEADLALYRAKGRGRDRAEVFDERLRTSAIDRLTTERMLRRALDEERLVIEYQPIIDLRSHLAVGAEALVRIRSGDSALLQPESFIDVAKETGLLTVIDDRVLDDALRQATSWQGSAAQVESPAVSVNVTARHLADARFTDTVIDLLDACGLPPRCLQIEVTERILMETSNSAMKSLRALRRAGVQVGLDDFGTGYSSLAHLRQFPLDFVKIDRSCIRELDSGGSERSVVAAIIWLCHALDLVVIAEGVETPSQLEALEGLGCDRAQGFVFGPAGDPSLLSSFVYSAG